jgi:uncharacterized membrane protein
MIRLPKISLANAYALIALIFGGLFLVITPPFGVGDETAHFERSYEVATGQFLGAEGVPAGMQTLIDDAFGKVKSGGASSREDWTRWAATPLGRNDVVAYPDPIRAVLRLHSPLCYLHFAPVMATGLALNLPPLAIFFLARLAALLAGVALVRAAIARAPAMLQPPLVFLGLLPTTVVFLAGLNIESMLVGLGFYFFALIASHSLEHDRKLTRQDIAHLAAVGFLLGQFKTGYLLAPALAIILPAAKFSSLRARLSTLALIVLPGAAACLGWALVVKDAMLGDLVYSTMDGNHVEPGAQLAAVIGDPLAYAGVVFRTLFATDEPVFAFKSFLALGGWTEIAPPAFIYAVLSFGLALVWLSGERPPPALTSPFASAVQAAIFAATALAILTLVYFQWNGVGDPAIKGFQGRYLIAVAPLLIALAPARLSLLAPKGRREAIAMGAPVAGLIAMAAAVIDRYYA